MKLPPFRNAIVLGAGASGRAAARALLRRGVRTAVAVRAADSATDALAALGARVMVGDPAASVAEWAREHGSGAAVFSPGIPPSAPEFATAVGAGLRIVGELALGCSLFGGRQVAVTGSKGKSSLVKLLSDALSANGRPAAPCGNYGTPVCEVADREPAPAFAVLECSSFQLQTADDALRPEAAVLLNLSVDHLDRHGTLEAYRDAKLSLFDWQGDGALALLPAPDEDPFGLAAEFARRHPGRAFATFGVSPGADWRFADHAVSSASSSDGFRADVRGSYFDNDVLGPAAAAACAVLHRLGLSSDAAGRALRAFEPLPHRMSRVGASGGVVWIDNSKATSLAALLASVRMAPKPVRLLAGGRLKEPLSTTGKEVLDSGAEIAYTLGECGAEMARAWSAALPVRDCGTLEEAVRRAAADLAPGACGSVLLAPGTASFDQFRNFEERGDAFARLARSFAPSFQPLSPSTAHSDPNL